MAETKAADTKAADTTDTSAKTTSSDRFDDAETFAAPVVPTVEDAAGVERIVGTVPDGWEPAPVDPDPEDVKRAEARAKKLEEAKQARLDALKPAETTTTSAKASK